MKIKNIKIISVMILILMSCRQQAQAMQYVKDALYLPATFLAYLWYGSAEYQAKKVREVIKHQATEILQILEYFNDYNAAFQHMPRLMNNNLEQSLQKFGLSSEEEIECRFEAKKKNIIWYLSKAVLLNATLAKIGVQYFLRNNNGFCIYLDEYSIFYLKKLITDFGTDKSLTDLSLDVSHKSHETLAPLYFALVNKISPMHNLEWDKKSKLHEIIIKPKFFPKPLKLW